VWGRDEIIYEIDMWGILSRWFQVVTPTGAHQVGKGPLIRKEKYFIAFTLYKRIRYLSGNSFEI
jgi:hypothetical protein